MKNRGLIKLWNDRGRIASRLIGVFGMTRYLFREPRASLVENPMRRMKSPATEGHAVCEVFFFFLRNAVCEVGTWTYTGDKASSRRLLGLLGLAVSVFVLTPRSSRPRRAPALQQQTLKLHVSSTKNRVFIRFKTNYYSYPRSPRSVCSCSGPPLSGPVRPGKGKREATSPTQACLLGWARGRWSVL